MAPKRKHPIDIVMEKYSKKHCSDSSDSEDTTKDEELIVWPTDEEVLADAEDEIEDMECVCIDEEIADIRDSLAVITDDIKEIKELLESLKNIMKKPYV